MMAMMMTMIIVYLPEDKNTRNGNLKKNQRKTKTNMGDNHRYVCYNGSSKQSCGGHASITQIHMGSDVLARIRSKKKNYLPYITRGC